MDDNLRNSGWTPDDEQEIRDLLERTLDLRAAAEQARVAKIARQRSPSSGRPDDSTTLGALEPKA